MRTSFAKTTSLLFVVLGLFTLAFADSLDFEPLEPKQIHERTSKSIVDQVRYNHYNQNVSLNDAISEEIFERYLTGLDPRKEYFLSADVAEFEQFRTELDEALKNGYLRPSYMIFNRFRDRAMTRIDWVTERLSKGLDSFNLSNDRTITLRDEESDWLANEAEADQLWEDILVDEIIRRKLRVDNDEDVMDVISKRYTQRHRRISQMNTDDVFAIYMNSFSRSYDPHTEYQVPREQRRFDIQMSLSLEGIGAELRVEEDYVKIVRLIRGGPAQLHGDVKESDRIISVGQDLDGPLINVIGWRLDDVVSMILGPKGTTVVLELLSPDVEDTSNSRIVSIVRDHVKLHTDSGVSKEIIEVETDGALTRIGVIDLPSMYSDYERKKNGDPNYRSSASDVRRLIEELKQEDIEGLIIDLRYNGGGFFDEAHKLTSLFIPTGPTVLVKSTGTRTTVYRDRDPEVVWDGPLAVIVNRRSASASEIFAGAIQDYGRGIIVGSQTFGKGTVQQMFNLRYGRLKITSSKYYRVTGQSTQHRGVVPDIEFPSTTDKSKVGESTYENALAWDEIDGPAFEPTNDLSPTITKLRERHLARIADNPDFMHVQALRDYARSKQDEKEFSLNEHRRRQQKIQEDAWRLEVGNTFLAAHGRDTADTLDELEKLFDKFNDENEDRPDALVLETGTILRDFMDIGVTLASLDATN